MEVEALAQDSGRFWCHKSRHINTAYSPINKPVQKTENQAWEVQIKNILEGKTDR